MNSTKCKISKAYNAYKHLMGGWAEVVSWCPWQPIWGDSGTKDIKVSRHQGQQKEY